METTERTLERIMWNPDEQKFMLRRRIKTYINGTSCISEKIEWLPLSAYKPELVKKLSLPVIIRKVVTDVTTLEQLSGYFLNTIEISVLSDPLYQYKYVSIVDGKPFLHDLDADYTLGIALSGGNITQGVEAGIVKAWVGKEKRISDDEAITLVNKGTLVFEKYGDEFRILV